MKPEDLTQHLATTIQALAIQDPRGLQVPKSRFTTSLDWARARISCGRRSVALSTQEGTSGLRSPALNVSFDFLLKDGK